LLSAGFETAIPAIECPQTYALDRTDTGIGFIFIYFVYFSHSVPELSSDTVCTTTDFNNKEDTQLDATITVY
jgi:hypothetical protein